MILSMTGFATGKTVNHNYELVLEIKTYNAKGCDPHLKLSHEMGYMEQKFRKYLNTYVKRGKVYLYAKYTNLREKKGKVVINHSIIPEIRKSIATLEKSLECPVGFSYRDALSIPDFISVVYDSDAKDFNDAESVMEQFESLLESLLVNQEKEGKELKKDIEKRFRTMKTACEKIEKLSSGSEKALREKIERIITRVLDDEKINPEKIENELAVQLSKLDITEELVRLKSHLKQLGMLLDKNSNAKNCAKNKVMQRARGYKPVGLQIDFLAQEILREANTINSKSDDIQIIKKSLQIKTELTKLREQVKNIK